LLVCQQGAEVDGLAGLIERLVAGQEQSAGGSDLDLACDEVAAVTGLDVNVQGVRAGSQRGESE